MTTWTHRTIIVPDAVVVPARMACEALAGAGGSGMHPAYSADPERPS